MPHKWNVFWRKVQDTPCDTTEYLCHTTDPASNPESIKRVDVLGKIVIYVYVGHSQHYQRGNSGKQKRYKNIKSSHAVC